MARTHGDDDLFRLIHVLLPEEKRYFIRFAKRQAPRGNNYLKLFREVNSQVTFGDAALKKKFKNYKVIKVYLKEMIMDCMALYYRHSHPHIHLHNQFQKIHLLLIKGLHDQAVKTVGKALEECRKMELFALTSSLLSLRYRLSAHTFSTNAQASLHIDQYRSNAMENLEAEHNLIETDLLNSEWHLRFRTIETQWTPALEQQRRQLLAYPTKSLRAEVKKIAALQWAEHIRQHTAENEKTSRRLMELEQRLKNKVDSSYGTVFTLSNYIMLCLEQKQYAKAEKLCNKLVAGSGRTQFFEDVALIMSVLYKTAIYYHTARFEKGLDEIVQHEHRVLEAIKRINDKPRMRFFYAQKIILLFVNKKFRECWLCIRDALNILKQNPDYVPEVMLLQMMIQVEFGNLDLLEGMVKKAQKKINQMKRMNPMYATMLHLFRQAAADGVPVAAKAHVDVIKEHYQDKKNIPTQTIWWLRYDYWLQSKVSNETLEELVKRER